MQRRNLLYICAAIAVCVMVLVGQTLFINFQDVTPPAMISGLKVVENKDGAVGLSWNKSTAFDFVLYSIYQSKSNFNDVRTMQPIIKITNKTQTSHIVRVLSYDVKYYFAVTAVDTSSNENTWVRTVDITPTEPPPFYLKHDTELNQTTPTFDGSGQAVHPDIIHFTSKWNNYSYWMIFTPYRDSAHWTEFPSIIVSNDGMHWEVPLGLTNPIYRAGTFLPDPEFTWDGEKLSAFLGPSYYSSSTDGITWKVKKTTINGSVTVNQPSMIKENDKWFMWAMDLSTNPNSMSLFNSNDGIHWWFSKKCTGLKADKYEPWHITIQKVGSEYWGLLVRDIYNGTGQHARLDFINSTDGVKWHSYNSAILEPSADNWDNLIIYRSAFTVENGKLRVWYSGCNTRLMWHIGFTEIDVSGIFGHVNSDNYNVAP